MSLATQPAVASPIAVTINRCDHHKIAQQCPAAYGQAASRSTARHVYWCVQAERPGGGAVAVKALSLRTMADWKQLELFEKEADALRSLSHPGIPAYRDYFEVDSDGDRAYFLVQVSKAYTSACVHSAHHNIHTCCFQAGQLSCSFAQHYLSDGIACNVLSMSCSIIPYHVNFVPPICVSRLVPLCSLSFA